MEASAQLRIGELSRRTGVSAELLRAWERRYGLLRRTRTEGGFRLYSTADERRVDLMRSHLKEGLSAAEAARLTLAEGDGAPGGGAQPLLANCRDELRAALDALDESAAQRAVDRLLAEFSLQTALRDVLLPFLRELGESWASGGTSIGHEHFASQLLRGRLLGLGRGWDSGSGPRGLLACAPGEQHDLGLLMFALALRERGWRITYLGQDTPLETIAETARAVEPEAIIIAATLPAHFSRSGPKLRRLASHGSVWLAGPGASAALARKLSASLLGDDPLTAADRLDAARA